MAGIALSLILARDDTLASSSEEFNGR